MRVEELRVNNWVSVFKDTKYQVQAIAYNTVMLKYNDEQLLYPSIDQIHPIPLTEEWLLKFGFKLYEDFWIKDYFISLHKDGSVYESDDLPICINLQQVHQLQNLYFALTGVEL